MSIQKFNIWVIMALLFSLIALPALTRAAENEASIIFKSGTNIDTIIKHSGKDKSVKDQIFAMKTYTEPLTKSYKNIKINVKYAINNFIVYGTQGTDNLSAIQRYNLVKLYKTKNKNVPQTEADWLKLLQSPGNNSKCVTMSCLIALAQSCQKGELQYEYHNMPVPLIPLEGLTTDGATNYKIVGINKDNLCTFIIASKSMTFKLNQKGRSEALKRGQTNAEIDAQLKTMNDSTKSLSKSITTCNGTNKNISTYFTDSIKGHESVHCSADSNESTCTYEPDVICKTITSL